MANSRTPEDFPTWIEVFDPDDEYVGSSPQNVDVIHAVTMIEDELNETFHRAVDAELKGRNASLTYMVLDVAQNRGGFQYLEVDVRILPKTAYVANLSEGLKDQIRDFIREQPEAQFVMDKIGSEFIQFATDHRSIL